MTASERTLAYGTLEEDGDTWFLIRPDRMILLDVSFVVDNSLEHTTVSVIGKMGIPPSAPGITKLIVEKFASHEAITRRAYEIYESGRGGSADDNWVRAEQDLLANPTPNQHPLVT
jgi:hypothetical protein